MSEWRPMGARLEFHRPAEGDLIALEHTVWRVDRVQDLPLDNDRDRQMWIDRRMPDLDTWKGRPYRVIVTPVGGVKKPAPSGRSYNMRVRAGAYATWRVYPSGRWPQCSCCGEPMPCRAELTDRAVEQAGKDLAKMERRLPGCCWACEEPITRRQHAVTYPGDNLDLPTAQSPQFHLRLKCRYAAEEYEKRWLGADPARERVLTYPSCGGTLIVHHDGSSECHGGELDCRGHETHNHGHISACYLQSHGCGRGCSQVGHPGTRTAPRPERRSDLLLNFGGAS